MGKVIRIIGTSQDVTRRKVAEAALRESEERLQAMVRYAPDVAIQWYDSKGRVILWNEASEKLFGRTASETLGRSWEELMSIIDVARFRDVVTDIWESGKSVGPIEFSFRKRDGAIGTCLSSLFRIPGTGGSDWLVCMDVDITQRKQAEEARRNLESQIQQTQKLESLGVLAGGIAHDFNNLLTSVQGYSELARSTLPPDSAAAAYIDEAINGVQSAAELTQQLLAYSGKGRLAIQSIELSDLVADTSRLLEISISKHCQLERQLETKLPRCEGDPAQLRQVTMNMIINASEAIGETAGTIVVSTRCVQFGENELLGWHDPDALPAGRYILLEVSDSGCGMDKETQERLFDPFFTTKFTGRGLGMAAVLGIVRRHRGAIQVESIPGSGSTFRVFLPAIGEPEPPTKKEGNADGEWRGHGKVLLADDEASVRALASTLVANMGFEVIETSSGTEAIAKFEQQPNDIVLVLLDMTMPGCSGVEALKQMRALRPDISAILISGYDGQSAAGQFSETKIDGFLQKPFKLAALQSLIQSVLVNRS